MKIYAQHGYGDAKCEKIEEAFKKNYIDGVILGPKDINKDIVKKTISKFPKGKDIFFDSQFYISALQITPAWRIKHLKNYPFFVPCSISDLSREKKAKEYCKSIISFQTESGFNNIIFPSIFIERSFDSESSLIARNFAAYSLELVDSKIPTYATLAVSSSALSSLEPLKMFVNRLMYMDPRPYGFYIFVKDDERKGFSDFLNDTQLANLMYLTYSLSLNGYKVINGYSDLYSPLLGAIGSSAGASGLYSAQKAFSLTPFEPAGDGYTPPRVEKYLSVKIMSRINYTALKSARQIYGDDKIMNRLSTDTLYPEKTSKPGSRQEECEQGWDALKYLSQICTSKKELSENLLKTEEEINKAKNMIARYYTNVDKTVRSSPLDTMLKGIISFKEIIEAN